MCNTVCNTVWCLGAGVIRTTQTPPHVSMIILHSLFSIAFTFRSHGNRPFERVTFHFESITLLFERYRIAFRTHFVTFRTYFVTFFMFRYFTKRTFSKRDFATDSAQSANDVIRNSRCFQNLHESGAEKKYLGYKRFEKLYLQNGIAFTCCAISLKTIDLF